MEEVIKVLGRSLEDLFKINNQDKIKGLLGDEDPTQEDSSSETKNHIKTDE